MRVLVAGASGFIGSALVDRLRTSGHTVTRLVRRKPEAPDEHGWDPPAGRIDDEAFAGVDAVINLCGAPLFPGRWSAARKQLLLDSRVEPTEVLAEAVVQHGVKALVNASAVGVYGNAGDEPVDETAPAGGGFLAEMCVAWETATRPAAQAGVRVINLRSGLVLDGNGGLLSALKPIFSLGLGGKLGAGSQYMPWIAKVDEIAAIEFVLTNEKISGPVNLTGLNPVTNAEFTKELGHTLRRPAPWWVPAPALKLALGQAGEEMTLYGQRAIPHVLLEAGFSFTHSDISSALAAAMAKNA